MDTPQDLTDVEALLAERDALHGWIERLDSASSGVPASVQARVRDDYSRRIGDVTDRLRSHADTIAEKLAEDRDEHHELLGNATAAREALAEAELRYAVGEYDQDRYDAERTSHASDLETYDVALGAVAERIARLEEVHAHVSRAPSTERGDESVHAPVFHEHEGASPGDGIEVEPMLPDATEPSAIGIGELAPDDADELLAIFDEADERPSHDEPGPLSFRPTSAPPPEHETMRASGPRFARPIDVTHAEPTEPATVRDDNVVTTDEPSAAVARSARCGECGAMNLPMEWYCEKCGAELTTI